MPWTSISSNQYKLALVDGFIDTKRVMRGKSESMQEASIAERLCRLSLFNRTGKYQQNAPEPLHVFVIGQNGWTRDIPKSFAAIANGEDRDDYRMVIVGQGVDEDRPHFGYWNDRLRLAGMPWKKRHYSREQFRLAAKEVLEPMLKFYNQKEAPPKEVLDQFGVPYSYSGSDHFRSRDKSL